MSGIPQAAQGGNAAGQQDNRENRERSTSPSDIDELPHPEIPDLEIRKLYNETYPEWRDSWLKPLTAEQRASLTPPLTVREVCSLRDEFQGYVPCYRYEIEATEEMKRIHNKRLERDSQGRQNYRGLTVLGEKGKLRLRVMVRSTIRKRWQALGLWRPQWGIPGVTRGGDDRAESSVGWSWPWPSSDPAPLYRIPLDIARITWPGPAQERWQERSVRKHLESKGEWIDPHASWKLIRGSEVRREYSDGPLRPVGGSNKEAFIAGQTWYRFALEMQHEAARLARVCDDWGANYEMAQAEVQKRWEQSGDWSASWDILPTWEAPPGVTIPEPEDPSAMTFNAAEFYALEQIDAIQGPPWRLPGPPSDSLFGAIGTPSPSPPAEPPPDSRQPPARRRAAARDKTVRWAFLMTEYGPEQCCRARFRPYALRGEPTGRWQPPRASTPPPSPKLRHVFWTALAREEAESDHDEDAGMDLDSQDGSSVDWDSVDWDSVNWDADVDTETSDGDLLDMVDADMEMMGVDMDEDEEL